MDIMDVIIGVVGGIGPESTVEYYRLLIAGHRARHGDGSSPAIVINSLDATRLLDLAANDLEGLTGYLAGAVERLARAGATIGLLASNTPHIVFEAVQRRSPIPLVSIVEAAREAVQRRGFARVGLFGTRFTMDGRFYPDVFARAGIDLIVPREDERTFVHDIYVNELLENVFRSETRDRLVAIVDAMRVRDGVEAVILGGTELPLILREETAAGVPLLDTTRIHVQRILAA
ncbi:MAG TPA: amino acid racemase [Vicinamibacterales bacterium]|jgi:aspartate racemase|nr:amino acid racemase [Vicinamibacterales bacterium]